MLVIQIVQTSALPICRLYHLTEFKRVIMGTAYLHVPAHILYVMGCFPLLLRIKIGVASGV